MLEKLKAFEIKNETMVMIYGGSKLGSILFEDDEGGDQNKFTSIEKIKAQTHLICAFFDFI